MLGTLVMVTDAQVQLYKKKIKKNTNRVSNQQEKKKHLRCLIHYSQPANEVGTVGAINYG